MNTKAALAFANMRGALRSVGVFGFGMWRYWRLGEPSPASNHFLQKLYGLTDGRSNDILFRILESKRKESDFNLGWNGDSLVSEGALSETSIEDAVRTLRENGFVVIPHRLKADVIKNLYNWALSCSMQTMTFGSLAPDRALGTHSTVPIKETATSKGIDPFRPQYSVYTVPRSLLLENPYVQCLLCDPFLLAVATRYLGVFPVVTRPDMWWDTDFLPSGLRPRPFHTDSGCLRWLKVGINLTDTTFESPHFVFVKGSHRTNRITRPLTKRLVGRMNLSDKEVNDVCPERIAHITAPAGSITLADTRGIHKGELAMQGHRLVLYFGLEGSAFNCTDTPVQLSTVGNELAKAMNARPFSYQFFRA